MGLISLAFRAGAQGKRAHIFWQRRIREGDVGEKATPYWFPAKTDGGMMREDRLVLPIPPGVHWKSEMPMLIPGRGETCLALGAGDTTRLSSSKSSVAPTKAPKSKKTPTLMPPTRRGARFGPPPEHDVPEPVVEKPKPEKKKREKIKAAPAHVAMARELRDRYLAHVNTQPLLSKGKYDVSRAICFTPPALTRTADRRLLSADNSDEAVDLFSPPPAALIRT